MRHSRAFAAVLVMAVVAAVLGMRAAGLLQGLELALYDQWIRYASKDGATSSRIAIVAITEEDIRELGHWPVSDRTMAELLRKVLAADPRVVGLDIYRDLPVPPGEALLAEVLQGDPRIIAVRKFGGVDDEGIPGPRGLVDSERVGFNDILLDPDTTVRRGLLFLDEGDGAVEFSFALRVALAALAREGVRPIPDSDEPSWLRLGPTTIRPWQASDGGYAGADAAGYQFLLDFSSRDGGFRRFGLGPLMRGEVDPAHLRDKIVLVGVMAKSLPDVMRVPFRPEVNAGVPGIDGIPGIEMHAYMIRQLVRHGLGESKPMRILADWQELLLVALTAGLGCTVGFGLRRGGMVLGVSAEVVAVVLGVVALWIAGAAAYRVGWWIPMGAPGLAWLASAGVVTVWESRRERSQRALLMQLFSRHVSPEIADEIWQHRDEFLAEGRPRPQRLTATVLFVDMRGYTSHAEKMDPESLLDWLNDFMGAMAREVARWGGVVDDYFGDGLKANFGVPFGRDSEDEIAADARRAVDCAMGMASTLDELNRGNRARGVPTVTARVGVHTGAAVAGSLGSADRLKYTVVGDVAVTAQRLESLDKVEHDFDRWPCRILVSDRTHACLNENYQSEALGRFSLKGKGEEVAVYRVTGVTGAA
jgi:adenylate cyclase